MHRAKVLRLIQSVADDPPADVRKVERRTSFFCRSNVLPKPEAAELRMRNIRMRLDINMERRPALRVDRKSHPKRFSLGDQ